MRHRTITADSLRKESDRLSLLSTEIGKLYSWGATHKHAIVIQWNIRYG